MADKKIMTPEEKALLQARHRQEEAEARNRKKERDARTHRLVQEGAILESIVPHIKEMDLDSLKRELMRYGNLSYASQSRQPWFRSVCCCCFCLYEL